MKTQPKLAWLAAAALALGAAGLQAQTSPTMPAMPTQPAVTPPTRQSATTAPAKSPLEFRDRHFIRRAAEVGTEEIDIAQVVAQLPADPQVRTLADSVVSSQKPINRGLTELAARKNVSLSNGSVDVRAWRDLKPQTLDKDFVARTEKDYKTLIGLFEKAAQSDDADVSALAQKYLAGLRQRYTQAASLENRVTSASN